MISGARDRVRAFIIWAVLLSLVAHAIIAVLIPNTWHEIQVELAGESRKTPERIVIERRPPIVAAVPQASPVPQKTVPPKPVRERPTLPPTAAAPQHHELAKETPHAPPQPPARPHTVAVTPLQRDQENFAKEVAQLNKSDDPHAIPTIDPASAGESTKSYRFDFSRGASGDEHGDGVITPLQSWHDRGLDCYYARYEYTYPSGETEDGEIVWPICYTPDEDPFPHGRHRIPFPLPEPGYKLPAGTDLPPLEKYFYDAWTSGAAP